MHAACSVFTGTHTVTPSEGLCYFTRYPAMCESFSTGLFQFRLQPLRYRYTCYSVFSACAQCWRLEQFQKVVGSFVYLGRAKNVCWVCVAGTCLVIKKVSEVYKLSKVDHPKWWTFEHYCIISQYWLLLLLLLYAGFIRDWIWIPEWSLILILNIYSFFFLFNVRKRPLTWCVAWALDLVKIWCSGASITTCANTEFPTFHNHKFPQGANEKSWPQHTSIQLRHPPSC